jgi:heme-degrading monooxygenase HmoA
VSGFKQQTAAVKIARPHNETHHQNTPADMYSSTFIFATKQFDDEFHRLDQAIAEAARSIPGYLGEEAWENTSTGLVSNIYYWESLEALQALVQHPKHLEAKAAQEKWLDGYQVVISQVMKIYGDARLGALPVSRIGD